MNPMSTFKVHIISIIAIFLFGSVSGQAIVHPAIQIIWVSEEGLQTPESVLFDAKRNVLYVSNINGNSAEKDGNGFIAKLDTAGHIIKLDWVNGLNAPKGMGIWNNRLYVADIDNVVEIDISTGQILQKYEATDAVFLNDITCDVNGQVYISDTRDTKIYRLWRGKMELWLKDARLDRVNGLLLMNDYLLAGVGDAILRIRLSDKSIEPFLEHTGRIDGLVPDGEGNYLFSDWDGDVYIGSPGKPIIQLLDTKPVKENAADIDYIVDKNILLVPTFMDNHITAYRYMGRSISKLLRVTSKP